MVFDPSMMGRAVAAPSVAGGVAVGARWLGQRFGRPILTFGAAGAGLIAGWGAAQGFGPRTLPVVAAAALLIAGLGVRAAVGKKSAGRKAPRSDGEAWIGLSVLAVVCGWWLGGVSLLAVAGAAAILTTGALVLDGWGCAAGAVSLWAALLAVGAKGIAGLSLVAAAACLGGGPVLPLVAGLGGVLALVSTIAVGHVGHAARWGLVVAAPIGCLGLSWWWRGRFLRFGRAADAMRAGVATVVMGLLVFSAAAMAGLR